MTAPAPRARCRITAAPVWNVITGKDRFFIRCGDERPLGGNVLEIRSRDPGTCALCAAVEKTRRALPAHPLLDRRTRAGLAR